MENKLLLRKSALKWVNEYYEKEEYVLLKILRKDLSEMYDVLIDKEDFEKVSCGQWYVSMGRKNTHRKEIIKILYTVSSPKKINYVLHQWILDSKYSGNIVDHINMNRLDNRKSNLRFVDAQTNRINQESTGWHYNKCNKVYVSNIYYKGVHFYLGKYNTKEDAEKIYLKACILTGYSDISHHCKSKIKMFNISITKEDYSNVYLNKLILYKEKGVIEDIRNSMSPKGLDDTIRLNNNNIGLGYNYDRETKKYLARIDIGERQVNIGRYETEKEANDIYLKACIIIGKDKVYDKILHRINENDIILTNEDMNNKYIKKVYNIFNNINEPIPNGRFNYKYDENIELIISLRNDNNYSWNKIANYLRENVEGLKSAKSCTVKRKYENYIEQQLKLNNN